MAVGRQGRAAQAAAARRYAAGPTYTSGADALRDVGALVDSGEKDSVQTMPLTLTLPTVSEPPVLATAAIMPCGICLCGCEEIRHRVAVRAGTPVRTTCKDCGCDQFEERVADQTHAPVAAAPRQQPGKPTTVGSPAAVLAVQLVPRRSGGAESNASVSTPNARATAPGVASGPTVVACTCGHPATEHKLRYAYGTSRRGRCRRPGCPCRQHAPATTTVAAGAGPAAPGDGVVAAYPAWTCRTCGFTGALADLHNVCSGALVPGRVLLIVDGPAATAAMADVTADYSAWICSSCRFGGALTDLHNGCDGRLVRGRVLVIVDRRAEGGRRLVTDSSRDQLHATHALATAPTPTGGESR